MWEWFTQDWWRLVWIPIIGLATPAMLSIWGRRNDARSTAEAAHESRQERWIGTLDKEIADLRVERDQSNDRVTKWEWLAHFWFRKAHEISHELISVKWTANIAKMKLGEVTEPVERPPPLPPIDQPWHDHKRIEKDGR